MDQTRPYTTVKHGVEFLYAGGHFVGTVPRVPGVMDHPEGMPWFAAHLHRPAERPDVDRYVPSLRADPDFGRLADVISWHALLADAHYALADILEAPDVDARHPEQVSPDAIRAARRDQGMEEG